jgi:hypothetical protein
MQMGDSVSSDEIVAGMLGAEIDADPWAQHIRAALELFGWSEDLVRRPDTSNPRENVRRARLLAGYRGWGRNHYLFAGFPADVQWFSVLLDASEVADLRYIRQDGWDSRSAVEGAEIIKAGGILAKRESTEKIKAIAAQIEKGMFESRQPLVIVAEGSEGPFTLLDGHHRATALALAEVRQGRRVPALLGVSASMRGWPFWPAP